MDKLATTRDELFKIFKNRNLSTSEINAKRDAITKNRLNRVESAVARPAVIRPSVMPPMSDILKPRFVINSLDKQNNLDRTQGVGDYKPIPSATFNGAVLGKVTPR
jgi:hypothetical protein